MTMSCDCDQPYNMAQHTSFWLAAAMANWVTSPLTHWHSVHIKSGQLRTWNEVSWDEMSDMNAPISPQVNIWYGDRHTMGCRHLLVWLRTKTHVHRSRLLTAAGPSTGSATTRLTKPCRSWRRRTTTAAGWRRRAAWTHVWRTVWPILCWEWRRWTLCWHYSEYKHYHPY